MAATRYSQYTCKLNDTTEITQLEGWSINPNTTKASITPGGAVDAAHHGIASASPIVQFSTRDFATLFGAVSVSTGLACTGSSTFIFQERADGSTFIAATTNTHETVTVAKGFLRPTSISCNQDDEAGALVECELTALWDSSTQPLVWNTGQVINGFAAPAFASRYFLGPVYHAGAEVEGVTSITVDPGINYVSRSFGGDPFPTIGAIVTRAPRMTFTVSSVEKAAGLTTLFGSVISTGLIFYLWKGTNSGTRVAVATAEHIKITASAGDWSLDEASVQGNDDGSVTFSAMPTTAITLVTNSAIP